MEPEEIKKVVDQAGKELEEKFTGMLRGLEFRMNTHRHIGSDLTQKLLFKTLFVSVGDSTARANVGGTLFNHYASVGNSTTVETDLYSDTIAASALVDNGDRLEAEYGGSFVSSGTATRDIKIYFGGTQIFDTGTLTLSLSSAWTVYATIMRVSSTVVRYMVSLTTQGAALAAYTAVGELTGLTLTNTNIFKITGQAAGAGAASNDIIAKVGNVSWYPAAS